MTIDTFRQRRLHPVFVIGALIVIATFHLSYVVVQTSAGMKMATAHFG